MKRHATAVAVALLIWSALAVAERPSRDVGTTLPADFPVIVNPNLNAPVIGFGAKQGRSGHVPVIFLHGNNDTPFATACNPYGHMHALAQYFADQGYRPGELWGLGYQGDQCDLAQDPTRRSGAAHTTAAAVPILRAFVRAVLDYTDARQVDIVGHSLGVTVAREWMRQDNAYRTVRSLVAIDGPNHGIVNCSPSPLNYWAAAANGGFAPDSPVCQEYGAADTPFLTTLNAGDETPGPTRYLVIRNVDADFVYNVGAYPDAGAADGVFPPVPAMDRNGNPHDFSASARLSGAPAFELVGQGQYDPFLGTSHLGILNSPETRALTLEFLRSPRH